VEVENPHTNAFTHALRSRIRPDHQMVVCMLPTNKKDLYDNIKQICCVERPVPSQCLISKTVSRQDRVMSVATKIAIQMNMKLGGQAWFVDIPFNGTMICGIDTYHDSSKKGRSVSALVCSMNKNATQYFSKVTYQMSHMELAQGLTINMIGKSDILKIST
jgi:aubergine-like protein